MTDSTPTRLAHEWIEAGNRKELYRFDEIFSPDTLDHVSGKVGVGWWKEIYERIYECFPDFQWEVGHLTAADDVVTVHLTATGTHSASSLGFLKDVPVSAARVRWEHHHTFLVREGRFVEHWATRDDIGLLRQIRLAQVA